VAEPLGERETERLGAGDGDAEGAALAVAIGLVPPAWHAFPLNVQSAGWPAVPPDFVSKPTVAVPFGLTTATAAAVSRKGRSGARRLRERDIGWPFAVRRLLQRHANGRLRTGSGR
jgi:hypothetical protein